MPDINDMPPISTANDTKLFCQTCGKRIHPESRFCRHCGAAIKRDPALSSDSDDFILPGTTTIDAAPSQTATISAAAPAIDRTPSDAHPSLFQTPHQQDEGEQEDDEEAAEHDIWQGRPAWRAFAGSWSVWLLVCTGVLAITFLYNHGGGPLVQAVWVFVGGSAGGLFARTALFVYGSRYRLTTERLFIHRGVLLRITDQIELIRVDDVRIRQNIIDRLLNTGTLDVFSSDETDHTIHLFKISDPATVAEDIRNYTRNVRQQHSVAVERI